jgi:hypothetical protein
MKAPPLINYQNWSAADDVVSLGRHQIEVGWTDATPHIPAK